MPLSQMQSRPVPLSSMARAKALFVMCATLIAGQAPAAAFEGASVPTSVRTLICDSNPRIVVLLANGTAIWYPANWQPREVTQKQSMQWRG